MCKFQFSVTPKAQLTYAGFKGIPLQILLRSVSLSLNTHKILDDHKKEMRKRLRDHDSKEIKKNACARK